MKYQSRPRCPKRLNELAVLSLVAKQVAAAVIFQLEASTLLAKELTSKLNHSLRSNLNERKKIHPAKYAGLYPKRLKMSHIYWFGRMYVALHVGAIAIAACFGSTTLFYQVIAQSGKAGFWCVLVLVLVSAVGVADVLINDLLPKKFQFDFAKRHRHFLLMALAIGPLSLAFVIVKEISWSVLHINLALPIIGASTLAVMDVYVRGREA